MKVQKQLEEDHKKKRQQDILLLLQHLASHEETTIKMVLDGLYDIGAVNLINQKFQGQFMNRRVKSIANLSKPLFRQVGFYWFKENCPQLIADWLYSQVEFTPPQNKPEKVVQDASPAGSVKSLPQLEDQRREIQQLRTQVRNLTGMLVGVLFVSGILIGGYLVQSEQFPLMQPIDDSEVVRQE